MSLKITNIQRVNPAPCDHYNVTVDVDGVSKVREIDLSQIKDAIQGQDKEEQIETLILSWAAYKLTHGSVPADLMNVEIA